MAQQTAVEWLIKEIKNFDSGRSQYYNKAAIYDHAYRMEKLDEWDEIEEEYMKDEYPVFGGPFTNALTPFEWLKKWYHSPKRK